MGIIQNVLLWHFPLVILRFERSFFSGITSLFLSCSMPSFDRKAVRISLFSNCSHFPLLLLALFSRVLEMNLAIELSGLCFA